MIIRIITCLAALCFACTAAVAQNGSDVRRRMEQRLGQLDQLKAQGVVGENNQGFVEIREGGNAQAQSLVSAENADREQVYAMIAKQTGASADSVGRARAKQIAANSRSGVWIQDESGRWHRK